MASRMDLSMAGSRDASRVAALLAAVVLHGGLLVALVLGLAPAVLRHEGAAARRAVTVVVPPPPPVRVSPAHEVARQLRRVAPGGAPKPAEALPVMPLAMTTQGSAVGPVSGGVGAGAGSGAAPGGGDGGGGLARPFEQIAGDINSARDYPAASRALRLGHAVLIVFTIGTDGRVRDCRVREPSPDPQADAITCRLAEQRFRFRPATDAAGRPVEAQYGWRQRWFVVGGQ